MRKFRSTTKTKASPQFSSTQELGEYGEQLAVEFLQQQKYRIVATNFLAPLGRSRNGRPLTGEIDIVAYDEFGVLRFIEVKTRTSETFATPQSAVDLRKQRQIIRASWVYRRIFQLGDESHRFDVVSIIAAPLREPKIELYREYFSVSRFQRSRWLKTY